MDRFEKFRARHPQFALGCAVIAAASTILGAADTPSDVQNWGAFFQFAGSDAVRWSLAVLGVAVLILIGLDRLSFFRFGQKTRRLKLAKEIFDWASEATSLIRARGHRWRQLHGGSATTGIWIAGDESFEAETMSLWTQQYRPAIYKLIRRAADEGLDCGLIERCVRDSHNLNDLEELNDLLVDLQRELGLKTIAKSHHCQGDNPASRHPALAGQLRSSVAAAGSPRRKTS